MDNDDIPTIWDTVEDVIGWIGTVFTVLYHIPYFKPFFRIYIGKSSFENTPPLFISILYVKCFLWYIYGAEMVFSEQVRYGYFLSWVICILSITIYLFNELKKYFLDTILNAVLLVIGTWCAYFYLVNILDETVVVGIMCIFSTFFASLYTIKTIYRVLKQKNFYLIKIYQTLLNLFACICWVGYGILYKDFFLIFIDSFGIIISVIQIVIYFNYKKKYPSIGYSSTTIIDTSLNEENKNEVEIKIDDDNLSETKDRPVKIIKMINKNNN